MNSVPFEVPGCLRCGASALWCIVCDRWYCPGCDPHLRQTARGKPFYACQQSGWQPSSVLVVELQRRRAPVTRKLRAVEYDSVPNVPVPVSRALTRTCGHECRHCGRCHEAGCRRCSVLCASALDEVMQRPVVPEDGPLPVRRRRRRFFGLF